MIQQAKAKNILIIGGSGFIGSNFLNNVVQKRINYKILSPNHKELDILNVEQLKKTFEDFVPEVVVNFAAHRDANSAEQQKNNLNGSAWRTNVDGVRNLSKACKEHRSFLVHISTDMVFSGSKNNPGPYDEDAQPETISEKLSWYGWTKAEGERVLNNKKSAIIRVGNVTQTLYDPKLDYVGKILYLFDRNKLYPLFNDQYLSLTYIPSMLEAIEALIRKKINGVFHVASKNVFTPYELGEYLIKKIRNRTDVVRGIGIDDYLKVFPHRYPQYGSLLAEETSKQLGVKLLDWKQIINPFIKKMRSPHRLRIE